MSFKKGDLYPCNPATVRGESIKLSASGEKIVYTNGRTVVVSLELVSNMSALHVQIHILY